MSIYKSLGSVAQEFNLVKHFMHYFAFSKAKVVHISKIHSLIVRILAVPFHRQKDEHCHQSKEKEFFDLEIRQNLLLFPNKVL